MNTARSILALLFSIALAGCALLCIDASQWDILASIEAAEIIETVGDKASISFSADSPDTDFGKAYRKMLTGHLLDNGIEVLGSAGDYLLNYQVQVVTHKDRNPRNTEVLITTELHQSGEIVQSNTRIYYFNPEDKTLYEFPPPPEPPNPSRSFQVTDQS